MTAEPAVTTGALFAAPAIPAPRTATLLRGATLAGAPRAGDVRDLGWLAEQRRRLRTAGRLACTVPVVAVVVAGEVIGSARSGRHSKESPSPASLALSPRR